MSVKNGLILCGALAGLQTGLTWADAPSYSQIGNLLQSGEAQQALFLLSPYEERLIGEPDFDILWAKALYETGDYEQAQFALDRVVMDDPKQVDAWILMSQIYLKTGHSDQARQVLALISQSNISPQSRDRIQQTLATINNTTDEQNTFLNGYMEISFGYDGNISSGPGDSQLFFPALGGYSSLGSYEAAGDWLSLITGAATITHNLNDRWTVQSQLKLTNNSHKSRKDYDDGSALLSVGLSHSLDDDILTITGNTQAYQLEQKLYQYYWSGQLSWQRHLTGYNWLNSYIQYIDTTYPDSPEDDTYRIVGGLMHLVGYGDPDQDISFFYGLYGGKEQDKTGGDRSHVGYTLWGAQLGGAYDTSEQTVLSSSLTYEARQYDGEDLYYQYGRNDQQWTISSSLDHSFTDKWHLIPALAHSHNRSNMALYDYNRTLFILSVKREF
ncbi:MAG: tetratricopeptide repeat protein [Magnetococcales bacterium]|nr:tetratricopeptide repeat protein [Magnetococcales bacterium]